MHETVDAKGLAALILAAGSSSRMGRPKQLLPWKGKTLLDYAVEKAKRVTPSISVVLGANAEEILKKTTLRDIDTTVHEGWSKGIGSSIAHGVAHLSRKSKPKAVLIMLVDQPLIPLEHLKNLATSFFKSPSTIIATDYKGRHGVPAIFDSSHFDELCQLNNDFGARELMAKHLHTSNSIKSMGQTIDIDTQENYETLYTRYGQ